MTQTILSAHNQILGKMESRATWVRRSLRWFLAALQPSEGAPQSMAYDIGETDERQVPNAPDMLVQASSFTAMLNRNL